MKIPTELEQIRKSWNDYSIATNFNETRNKQTSYGFDKRAAFISVACKKSTICFGDMCMAVGYAHDNLASVFNARMREPITITTTEYKKLQDLASDIIEKNFDIIRSYWNLIDRPEGRKVSSINTFSAKKSYEEYINELGGDLRKRDRSSKLMRHAFRNALKDITPLSLNKISVATYGNGHATALNSVNNHDVNMKSLDYQTYYLVACDKILKFDMIVDDRMNEIDEERVRLRKEIDRLSDIVSVQTKQINELSVYKKKWESVKSMVE